VRAIESQRAQARARGMVPFDPYTAKEQAEAVRDQLQSCKSGDVTGVGQVLITFAPTGEVKDVLFREGPFAGTLTGTCILERYRAARVPPFNFGYEPGSTYSIVTRFQIR
jgi:hypothetical protein